MTKKALFFRYLAYSVLIILLLVLQATPKLFPEILGSKPILLVSAALAVGAVEEKTPALIFGAVCGLLADSASGGYIGFFAIALTLVCYLEAHIFSTYFVSGFVPVLIVSAVAVPLIIFTHFLIFTVFGGVRDCWVLFLNHYVGRILGTFAFAITLYPLTRAVRKF